MEIKYTLEILTKDIQDIGKLVENLQKTPGGSTLELDLALSKLRNVYDVLSDIRSDMDRSRQESRENPDTGQMEEQPETDEQAWVKAEEEARIKAEAEAKARAEEEAGAEKTPPPDKAKRTLEHAEILAEKFLKESSINENLAGNRKPDMDAKLMGKPIDSISRNIGINDRFLIIRELFEGNSDRFGQLIADLDQAGSLETASSILAQTFDGEDEHEGIKILANLVKRRYPSS
jgi:hypothetical protein